MAAKKPAMKPPAKKLAKWTECECGAEMQVPGSGCLACALTNLRKDLKTALDDVVDRFGVAEDSDDGVIDRYFLDDAVDAINRAIDDMEQCVIDEAREKGLMTPMP